MSLKDSEPNDCFACRLITGFAVVGIGVYLYAQAKKRRKIEMHAMQVLATGTVGIGLARLFNMNFLKSTRN